MNVNMVDLRTGKISPVPGSEGIFSPHWSPDGRHLAALSSANTSVLLFDFETRKWSELADIPAAIPN